MFAVVKLIIQIILFGLFLCMYGLPAFKKMEKESTVVIKTKNHTDGIPVPSITILAINKKTGKGWKSRKETSFDDIILHKCKSFSSFEDCLDSETFSEPDFINDTLLGYETKLSVMNETNAWEKDFTVTWYGMSYTFQSKRRIGPNFSKDQFFILLEKNYTYRIFVHSKNFFVINSNTRTLPSTYVKLIPDASNDFKLFYTISATQHIEMNVREDPCVESDQYNFASCIKESLARKVGCRPSWDKLSNQTVEICTNFDQHR